jgi:hypothetical protein
MAAKRQALESKSKVAADECKELYRSKISLALSQSKLHSDKDLQNFHQKAQRKALEKFKKDLADGPQDFLAQRENLLEEVGFE